MTRGRGRPPLPPDTKVAAELSLNLTNGDYDALHAIAAAERTSIQAIIRRVLARWLRAQRERARAPRHVTIARRLGL